MLYSEEAPPDDWLCVPCNDVQIIWRFLTQTGHYTDGPMGRWHPARLWVARSVRRVAEWLLRFQGLWEEDPRFLQNASRDSC